MILVSPKDYSNFLRGEATSFASKEELHDSGSLMVFFRVSLQKNFNWHDETVELPYGNVVHFQYRPNADIAFYGTISRPNTFPISMSEEKIHQFLNFKIIQKIN